MDINELIAQYILCNRSLCNLDSLTNGDYAEALECIEDAADTCGLFSEKKSRLSDLDRDIRRLVNEEIDWNVVLAHVLFDMVRSSVLLAKPMCRVLDTPENLGVSLCASHSGNSA